LNIAVVVFCWDYFRQFLKALERFTMKIKMKCPGILSCCWYWLVVILGAKIKQLSSIWNEDKLFVWQVFSKICSARLHQWKNVFVTEFEMLGENLADLSFTLLFLGTRLLLIGGKILEEFIKHDKCLSSVQNLFDILCC
jgi:hypothetical protein